jgi:hypothetical protein
MRYENLGQLTLPNQMNLGNDGRLYLSRSNAAEETGTNPQPISLKESVAWYRLGQEYGLSVSQGEKLSEWLKSIEAALDQAASGGADGLRTESRKQKLG